MAGIDQETRNPWDPMEGETPKAHAAFRAYAALGVGRSLDALADQMRGQDGQHGGGKRASGRLGLWSSKWDWVARARAWDQYLARKADEAAVEESARLGTDLAARRQNQVEDDWALAQRLRAQAVEMLSWPLFTEETSEDGQTVTRTPAKWTMRDVVAMARLSSELGRLALGMPTRVVAPAEASKEGPGGDPGDDIRVPPALAAQWREAAAQFALRTLGAEAPTS